MARARTVTHDPDVVRPGVGRDFEGELTYPLTLDQVQRDAAQPVAAHLGRRTVGVHDAHERLASLVLAGEEHTVRSDAEVAVAQTPRKLGSHPWKVGLLYDQEIVAQPLVLREAMAHPNGVLAPETAFKPGTCVV
jgi:hypothetical protein